MKPNNDHAVIAAARANRSAAVTGLTTSEHHLFTVCVPCALGGIAAGVVIGALFALAVWR